MSNTNDAPAVQFGKLALGAMNFGKRTSEADAKNIMALALEHGVTLFDTANAYVDGESERIVGRFLRGKRDRVQIATKVGFGRNVSKPEGLSKARILAAIDESLERLAVDHVDVYYLHVPDHATKLEESLDAIAEILEKKKSRAWGISNYASWQILEMMHIADARKMQRPVISQQIYNLLIRQLDVEYWKFTSAHPIHTTVYNPLAGGMLTGRHKRDGSTFAGSRFASHQLYRGRYANDVTFDRVDELHAIAESIGMSLVELSYAWLAGSSGKPGKPSVDSILVGPGSLEHLQAAIDATKKIVPDDARKKIDEAWVRWMGTETTYAR